MTAVVLALLVGLYFLISGPQHKSATIHCQKIAQTPPPKHDFVGWGRSFYSFIYGSTAQFPPSGLSTASAGIVRCCLTSVGRPRTLSLTYGDWVIAYLYCGKVSPRRGRYKLDNLYQPFPCRKIAPKIIRPTRDRKTGIRYNRGNRKSTLQATARKGTR